MATTNISLACCKPKCNFDAVLTPEFHFVVRDMESKKPKSFTILLDLGYCEKHSMILMPEHILDDDAIANLEERLIAAGNLAEGHKLDRSRFLLRWIPITQVDRRHLAKL